MTTLLHSLNWADYVILAVVIISTIIGLIRGFIRETLSLVVWIAAFVIAFKFAEPLANVFSKYIQTPSLRLIIAFAILFIATLIVGSLLSYLLIKLVNKTGLSGTDRVLGMLFGFIRGVLVIAVLLLLISLATDKREPWQEQSRFIPHFKPLVTWLHEFLPQKASEVSQMLNNNTTTPATT